ncbi:MAG: ABC transporter permease [Armatimonadota bacterium]|nr:ABC transporter permease [Armatimonadota bacterium]
MLMYVVRRLLHLVPVLLGISFLVFLLVHLVPGDPVRVMLQDVGSPEQVERVRHQLGLDRPLAVQYASFLARAVRGDFGRSIHTRRPVAAEIRFRIPYTVRMAVAAMLVAVVIGIVLGSIAAMHHQSALDYGTMVVALAGVSLPSFWFGLVLILVFSLHLRWLPPTGADSLLHLVLPAITLGSGAAAIIARLTRSSMLEVLRQDYIRTARAKGVTDRRMVYRHALKNALIPVVSIVGLQFASLLGGAVIVETVFGWPGIGRLAVDAIFNRDIPVIQAVVLVAAAIFVLVNLLVDLLYGWLDPRIRYG